jgi:glycosyltransferase involved in cell wall biosynthesis
MTKRPLTLFLSHTGEMLTDHRAHGDGLVAHATIMRLAARGHRIHVLAQAVDLKYPLPPNVILHPLLARTHSVVVQRADYMWRSRKVLEQVQRHEHIDIIHQMNPVFGGLSLAFFDSDLPIVLGIYAARWPDDPDGMIRKDTVRGHVLDRMREWWAATQQRRAAALLLSTPAAMNQIPDGEAMRDRVHIIPYGTDADYFTPAEGWDSPERIAAEQSRPTILFLASINRRKGIFTLVEAFESVASEFPNAILQVVGSGSQLDRVKALVAASPMAYQVQFLGQKTRCETLPLYRDCTVFCSPSLGEPFGMAPVEAMGCARALVTTAAGGLQHTAHPDGSIKVPPGDATALAQALRTLLLDPERRVRMGRFNREWMQQTLSWDTAIPQLEDVYYSLPTRKSA